MRRLMRRLAPAALLIALLGGFPAAAGEVRGQVTLAFEGTRLADLGPVVVFLEREQGTDAVPRTSRARIRQYNARFDPEFLVVTAGQDVEMPNEDTIFHNVFSFSKPNDFDLGVYPSGESRTVSFRQPGLVKLYCSIHESMSGAVLVTPSPWFATASGSGSYRIKGVPAGSYRVTAWNEKLPTSTRRIEVAGDGTRRADLTLGAHNP